MVESTLAGAFLVSLPPVLYQVAGVKPLPLYQLPLVKAYDRVFLSKGKGMNKQKTEKRKYRFRHGN